MPLISLKTNLKSLRYGKDRPGGGSSNQPFIQTSLKNSFDLSVAELGQTGGNFIIRGGTYAATHSAKDVSRLTKLFTESIIGSSFMAKQEALALTGQNYGAGGPSIKGFSGPNLFDGNSEGPYLYTNTIAQAGTNAFGVHGNKQGVNPFPVEGNILGVELDQYGRPTYSSYIAAAVDKYTNKLVYLNETSPFNYTGTLFSYKGGPNSELGLTGETRIKFATSIVPGGARTGLANPLVLTNPSRFFGTEKRVYTPGTYLRGLSNPYTQGASGKYLRLTGAKLINPYNELGQVGQGYYFFSVYDPANLEGNTWPTNTPLQYANGSATFTQQEIINQESYRTSGKIQDFRKKVTVNDVLAKKNGMLTAAPNYTTKNIEKRVLSGDPGSKERDRSNYAVGNGVVDKITALYMYESDKPASTSYTNDLVKFRFAVLNPDDPTIKTYVHFRAFFKGGIQDNMSAQWDAFKYIGRAEQFFNYTGFTRDVSFGFTVVAQSKNELSIMYQKLNYLQSTLAPDLNGTDWMRGNIHLLTIGGYFYDQPGVITSLNYSLPEDSTWEIGINTDGGFDHSVKELPHRIEVIVNFKPIHNFIPSTISSGELHDGATISSRFIALSKGDNTTSLYDLGTSHGINAPSTAQGNIGNPANNEPFYADGDRKNFIINTQAVDESVNRILGINQTTNRFNSFTATPPWADSQGNITNWALFLDKTFVSNWYATNGITNPYF